MDRKAHWEKTYADRRSDRLSWYQQEPLCSLAMIQRSGTGFEEPVIDVGGGASVLVDCLLQAGYQNITVLDVSSTALASVKLRLGDRSSMVEWIEADITDYATDHTYALWHDRAVFHFLTQEKDRKSYVHTLRRSLSRGGQVIIAAFAIGGPEKCSGLDIVQYDSDLLSAELGPEFHLLEQIEENHQTPAGGVQKFGYFRFIRE